MLRFRDFTHSVQTGRPCRCFQVGEDISVQKGSPFGFIYLSGMFGDDGSNKNSFGGTGQENLAPRVGFFLWDTVLPIFMDSISPPRHWNPHKDI